MRLRSLHLPGLDVALAEAGAGGRPLLVLHGFCGAKEDFTDWLDPLAGQGWHAVAYDQRGHGTSGHPAGEDAYSLAIFAADVVRVADALGWDHFALLGHSMGGMVAQLVALSDARRLDALILMDTGHGVPDGVDDGLVDMAEMGRQVVRAGGMAALVEALRVLEAGQAATAPPGSTRQAGPARPGDQERGEAQTLAASPDMWLAMSAALLTQPDRLAALAGLRRPTLVVTGAQDVAFVGQSRELAAAIPGATLAVIPGAGHSPQAEAPQAWWAAVSGFLAGVPA